MTEEEFRAKLEQSSAQAAAGLLFRLLDEHYDLAFDVRAFQIA